MSDIVADIIHTSEFGYWIVLGLTLLALPMIRMSASWPVTLFCLPGIALGGLIGIYAFHDLVVLARLDADATIVMAAGCGVILGLMIMLTLVRMVFAALRINAPERAGAERVA